MPLKKKKISTKVLLNDYLLKTSVITFWLTKGKKWCYNFCLSVSLCWTKIITVLLVNIWSGDHFLYFSVKWMKRNHLNYCKNVQFEYICNCNFSILLISNFTQCFYTNYSYSHSHLYVCFPLCIPIKNIYISVLYRKAILFFLPCSVYSLFLL